MKDTGTHNRRSAWSPSRGVKATNSHSIPSLRVRAWHGLHWRYLAWKDRLVCRRSPCRGDCARKTYFERPRDAIQSTIMWLGFAVGLLGLLGGASAHNPPRRWSIEPRRQLTLSTTVPASTDLPLKHQSPAIQMPVPVEPAGGKGRRRLRHTALLWLSLGTVFGLLGMAFTRPSGCPCDCLSGDDDGKEGYVKLAGGEEKEDGRQLSV